MGRRKLGKQDKAKKQQQNVETYSVTKEDLLENLTKEKALPITKEVIAKFDIKPVGRITRFAGKNIHPFAGETYEESLTLAYEWRDRENARNGHEIVLVDYYPQVHSGKSILVSFNIRTKEVAKEE